MVRDQGGSCSLAEGLAINLRLTLVIDQGNYVELPLIKLDKLVMLGRLLFLGKYFNSKRMSSALFLFFFTYFSVLSPSLLTASVTGCVRFVLYGQMGNATRDSGNQT